MTERTPAETVEAVAKFLEDEAGKIPVFMDGAEGYAWAIFKMRACALTMRLSTPPVPKERLFNPDKVSAALAENIPSGHTHCPGCDTELVSGMCPLCGFRPLVKPRPRARVPS